jgi:hypothetical protein
MACPSVTESKMLFEMELPADWVAQEKLLDTLIEQ